MINFSNQVTVSKENFYNQKEKFAQIIKDKVKSAGLSLVSNKDFFKHKGLLKPCSVGIVGLLGLGGLLSGIKIKNCIENHIVKNEISRQLSVSPETIIDVSTSKYMDKQKEAMWCQLYAFQGMLNKNFNIKPTARDLYHIAFPKDNNYEEENYMKTDDHRKNFVDEIIKKYKLNAEFEFFIKETDKLTTEELIDVISKMYQKCGAICLNSNVFEGNEHALLLSEVDIEHNRATIETWGYSITFKLKEIAQEYLSGLQSCQVSDRIVSPFDQQLRIYGLKNNKSK